MLDGLDDEMAIWPFGRKSKKSSTIAEPDMPTSKALPPDSARKDYLRESSDKSVPTLGRHSSRKDSLKRRRGSQGKLTKADRSRTRNPEKVDAVPAVPTIPQSRMYDEFNEKTGSSQPLRKADLPNLQTNQPAYYSQNPMSASSLQPEKFTVIQQPPTLQNRRGGNDQGILRRKSSKRKADDHAREQEIKAMISPIPIPKRPTSHNSGMLARENKRIPNGLNRKLDRPMSDVSLPIPESMRSQISVTSEQHAFKVSAFDALSPRPTIRYSENPRSASGSLNPSRASTRKEKQPMIPEDDKQSRRRIDDLADDMDAGTIKELMERDRRRLDKKRRSDHEKLERRLQRRSDKQKEREATAGKAPKEKVSQDVGKDENVGLGVAPTAPQLATTLQEPAKEQAVTTPESWLKDASREHLPSTSPFHDAVAGASRTHLETPTPEPNEQEQDVHGLQPAKTVRTSSAAISPPTSPLRQTQEPSNPLQSPQAALSSTPDIPEIVDPDYRRDSDTSNRFSNNWKSIFRRSDTRAKRNSTDRGRFTPSEFSNTSRESVARQMQDRQLQDRQMPPSAFTRIPRARSGTPIRAQSRFKEDLPELPLSPPDSRMQSPEALPDIPGSRGTDAAGLSGSLSNVHPALREEVALSRSASQRERAHSPDIPTSAIMAQSLASVDSEGSWLTGRGKRSSQQQFHRESVSSLQQRLEESGYSEEEDLPGTPDEQRYMGSLIPNPNPPTGEKPTVPARKRPFMGAAARIGGDSDDESSFQPNLPYGGDSREAGTWHGTVGKHPTIVRQGPGPRIKSREGLLNDFQAEESAESSPSGDSPVSPDIDYTQIQRATSVDIGKGHARHISAGSAKLLNLPSRSSQELKRLSASSGASGERSPLGYSAFQSPRLQETRDSDVD